jgi:hypothetical protein
LKSLALPDWHVDHQGARKRRQGHLREATRFYRLSTAFIFCREESQELTVSSHSIAGGAVVFDVTIYAIIDRRLEKAARTGDAAPGREANSKSGGSRGGSIGFS